MKKLVISILALAMCISMTACGSGNKIAFETSKAAYDNIAIAYETTEQFGSDIYEAWRMGIYNDDEILEDGVSYLAKKLSLEESELTDGVCYAMAEVLGTDLSELSDDQKTTITSSSCKYVFKMMEDSLFSFCIKVVVGAYIVNGKIEETQNALDNAKTQMKELSEKYSDYEHYPNLKGYYTTTTSFFDFCQNPTGSFQQAINTINDYKNEARDYISDLDYIFEEE